MTILYEKDWIQEEWFTPEYQAHKHENFKLLDAYLSQAPKTILDIGCGLAWESRHFNQQHGSMLYLLDGDYDNNAQDGRVQKQARYSKTVEDFAFYYKLDFLRQQLDQLDTQNYQLIDCCRIDLEDHIKFDLITSWVSCGFHYPVNTYRELILKHSHNNTVVVMDLRIPAKQRTPLVEPEFEIVEIINQRPKYATSHIRFI
jgi:SAM-dependent methyltransferase